MSTWSNLGVFVLHSPYNINPPPVEANPEANPIVLNTLTFDSSNLSGVEPRWLMGSTLPFGVLGIHT